MERIQLVYFKLKEIEDKYYNAHFSNIKDGILSFVNIEPANYWVNVTLKEDKQLPSIIAEEIKNSFIVK